MPPAPPELSPRPASPAVAERVKKAPWYKREYNFGRPVKAEDLMNFSRQAASFLSAGIPILDALAIVAEETSSKNLAEVLHDVRQRVRAGSSFGDAVAAHPRVFPGHYIAMVRASELTGNLDVVFDQLSSYLERDLEAKRQVKSALTYPAIVMVLAVVAVIVMATFILPKFKDLYKNLGAKLPLPTRMLLGMTDYVARVFWQFRGPKDSTPAFSTYVGYYDRQAQGHTMHSPKNCLPGAGWEILSAGTGSVSVAGRSHVVNKYLLKNGVTQALVFYWYQGRGRIVASEYAVKWNLLRDAALEGHTEEALVRIVVFVPDANRLDAPVERSR